jgi:hemerythrin-like domain-containing protein
MIEKGHPPGWGLSVGLLIAGSVFFSGCGQSGPSMRSSTAVPEQQEGVSAPEDLMREHGVLRRVLLVYQECISRLDAGRELPPGTVKDSAQIIRTFIEGYHEKLEEDYLFVRFEKAGVLVDLVKTLRTQHEAGRALTADILRLAGEQTPQSPDDRARLARDMREFAHMYRPHSAREDTVLFPVLRRVYSPKEYENLGETFEDKEHEMFGEGGFEKMVDKVAAIEKALGIYELSQFTPKTAKRNS